MAIPSTQGWNNWRKVDRNAAKCLRQGEFRISYRVGYCVLADGWFSLTTKPAEMLSFYSGVNNLRHFAHDSLSGRQSTYPPPR